MALHLSKLFQSISQVVTHEPARFVYCDNEVLSLKSSRITNVVNEIEDNQPANSVGLHPGQPAKVHENVFALSDHLLEINSVLTCEHLLGDPGKKRVQSIDSRFQVLILHVNRAVLEMNHV